MACKNKQIDQIDELIGRRVCHLRIEQGLARVQLARRIGVTLEQLQKYETGKNKISKERMLMIAKVLDKNVSYFYERIGVR